MALIIAYLVVFILAATPFFEVVAVIALGVAAGLPTFPVVIVALIGNLFTIYLLILLMDQVKAWLQRRKEKKGKEASAKKTNRAEKIWKRFGLPGLSLLAPILIGSHLGVILAMGFGGTKKQITVWMTVSILLWAIVTGICAYFGVDFLFDKMDRNGFLIDYLQVK